MDKADEIITFIFVLMFFALGLVMGHIGGYQKALKDVNIEKVTTVEYKKIKGE